MGRKLVSKLITISMLTALINFANAPQAFAGTSYSFTNAGATGLNGPTQAQINSSYSGTSLAGLVTINTQGIQKFTVPVGGQYVFELAGAKGGNGGVTGGSGAKFSSDTVTLVQGEVLQIGVGQIGLPTADATGAGGGGASWIYRESNSTLLAIAGGGGGGGILGVTNAKSSAQNSSVGSGEGGSSSSGQIANGGTSGNGGINAGSTCGLGGAGWLGNGTSTSSCARAGSSQAVRINSTAIGGTADTTASGSGGNGGFGGGGGGAGSCGYGGGGGGYSGGGGGTWNPGCGGPGGAGGSFSNVGFNWIGTNAAVGYVTITAAAPSTSSFNSLTVTSPVAFRSSTNITANVSVASRITFRASNVIISGCKNILATGSGSSFSVTCSWKPSKRGSAVITATSTPTNVAISGATATPVSVNVVNRSGAR